MPYRNGRLTAMERSFVKHMASTNDQTYAATKAGYADPMVAGSKLARSLKDNVREAQMKRIEEELLPLAVDVHAELLRDKATPAGAKVSAVKLAYDATILRQDGDAGAKEPHEMTIDEIHQRLEALRREAADRAKPVIEGEAESSVFG